MEKDSLFKLFKITKPPIWMLCLGLILSLFSAGAGLALPLATKHIIENFSNGLSSTLIIAIMVILVLWIISSILSIYLLQYVGLKVVRRLRDILWSKMLHLKSEYYQDEFSGELISRITNDTTALREFVSTKVIDFVTNLMTLVGAVVILFLLDVQMTIVLLLSVPVILLIIVPVGNKLYKISLDEQEEMSRLTGFLSQTLSEIKLVKAYGMEEEEYNNGKSTFKELFRFGVKRARIESVLAPLIMIASMAMFTFIIGFGAYRVSIGAVTSGDLVAFLLYLFQVIAPIASIGDFFSSYQKTKGATKRIRDILKEEEEKLAVGEVINKVNNVEFNNVCFAYGEKSVLKGVNFSADLGEMVAIVGPSGVGKSTIFSLMEQFIQPSSGGIKVNGQWLKEYSIKSWRNNIAYVQQDSPLIATSIKENMVYGIHRQVSESEIIEATKLAGAYDFIMSFSQGFDTLVGERGSNLSGGQKQRIAIARAILRNPNILLFDEATASLDTESEQIIQKSMAQLQKGRVTFVIAHRLSTIVQANKILVMQDGMITGCGTHLELIANHEFYRKLVEQQFLELE